MSQSVAINTFMFYNHHLYPPPKYVYSTLKKKKILYPLSSYFPFSHHPVPSNQSAFFLYGFTFAGYILIRIIQYVTFWVASIMWHNIFEFHLHYCIHLEPISLEI